MEEHIDNTEKIPNRCIGINDKGKLCRTRTRVGSYFCCDAHRPKNLNNLEEECNICCESVNINEIVVLKCGHAQHKECFKMWISRPNSKYCPLCLAPIKINIPKRKKKKEKNNSGKYIPHSPVGSPPSLVYVASTHEYIPYNQTI